MFAFENIKRGILPVERAKALKVDSGKNEYK